MQRASLVTLLGAFLGLARIQEASGAKTVIVNSCDELVQAAADAEIEDVTAQVNPSGFGQCGSDYGLIKLKNNHLMVEGIEGYENTRPELFQIVNMRFQVRSDAKLTWNLATLFDSLSDVPLEVNGGWLHVAKGSSAVFTKDVQVRHYVTQAVPEEGSDFAQDFWDGGCVWNRGYIRMEGHVSFDQCDTEGGGESPPGRGGNVFNGDTGFILFEGGVTMQETYLTKLEESIIPAAWNRIHAEDEEGNSGAGIYNLGKINFKGDSKFQELVAEPGEASGGAIFNAEGAEIRFKQGARATFIDCHAERGGAVFNSGLIRFSGPCLFAECSNSAIYNFGETKVSDGSIFWHNTDDWDGGGAITNRLGGTLDLGDDLSFELNVASNEELGCDDIYYEGDDDDFSCAP